MLLINHNQWLVCRAALVVRNLNENPGFAAEDAQYDAVICCVSVQYLQRPEVWRCKLDHSLKAPAPGFIKL